jgi:ADP-ribose pyrophosphatase YjhB (NUDIX family)
MKDLLNTPRFAERYEQLRRVRLNPRRHTAPTAHEHSERVAALAAALAAQNGCAADEVTMLENLGRAHDIGKISGTARPAKSLEVLASCGPLPEPFLALVKWHDISLPWWTSARRGQPPSDKAWRRLAREVDMRLLCMFMVADRVDAPSGWRRNAPNLWFFGEARRRGLLGPLRLDVEGHPSEISAGAALIRLQPEPQVLVIRVRRDGYELPKGGIEWDELATDAAVRELREEAAVDGDFHVEGELGHLEYVVDNPSPEPGAHLKRVRYFRVTGATRERPLPDGTRERIWVSRSRAAALPLVNEELRPLIAAALDEDYGAHSLSG